MDQVWTIRVIGTLVVLLLLTYLVHTVRRLTESGFRGARIWRGVGVTASVLLCGFVLFLVVIFTLQN